MIPMIVIGAIGGDVGWVVSWRKDGELARLEAKFSIARGDVCGREGGFLVVSPPSRLHGEEKQTGEVTTSATTAWRFDQCASARSLPRSRRLRRAVVVTHPEVQTHLKTPSLTRSVIHFLFIHPPGTTEENNLVQCKKTTKKHHIVLHVHHSVASPWPSQSADLWNTSDYVAVSFSWTFSVCSECTGRLLSRNCTIVSHLAIATEGYLENRGEQSCVEITVNTPECINTPGFSWVVKDLSSVKILCHNI